MTDTTKPKQDEIPMERIRVDLARSILKSVRFTDPSGNTAVQPSTVENWFSRPAVIQDAKGQQLCTTTKAAVVEFQRRWDTKERTAGDALRAGLGVIHFDAPVGSIPNLCKKSSTPAK